MKRLVDKLRAIWVLVRAKEFVLFTCDDFKTSKGGNCWVSYGIDNKEYMYDTFLDAAQEYIEKLKVDNMDIRDLEYGDLVLVNGTVNRVGYDLLHQMTTKDNTTWEIEGLPLTAEFLEANGFNDLNKGLKKEIKYSYARYIRWVNHPFGDEYGRDSQSIIVYWREDSSDVYVERPFGYNNLQTKTMCADIVYVHELQHLLNICGLNEISYEFQYGKQQD